MFKRIVGVAAVLTATIGALGMGYPQEEETQVNETNVLDAQEAAVEVIEEINVTQEEIAAAQVQAAESIELVAGGEAQIHNSVESLVEGEAAAAKRQMTLTAEELLLMQKVVSAEARGESAEAQYTVACVILNRIESEMFPNTLEEVVRQSGQFSCVASGAIINVPITESVMQAVASALDNNTLDTNILWFRSSYYHSFRTNAFQLGKLFFSTI